MQVQKSVHKAFINKMLSQLGAWARYDVSLFDSIVFIMKNDDDSWGKLSRSVRKDWRLRIIEIIFLVIIRFVYFDIYAPLSYIIYGPVGCDGITRAFVQINLSAWVINSMLITNNYPTFPV